MLDKFQGKISESSRKLILTGILGIIWYSVSLVLALLEKYIATIYKKPLTLSFVQLVCISIFSVPLLYFSNLNFKCVSKYYLLRLLLPLSILKAITTASGHLAIWIISVSYSQIMLATMPVFTALFSYLILRNSLSLKSYLTLVPIVLGVVIDTLAEAEFSLTGMLYGLLQSSGSSLQTIFNKMLMEKSKLHSFQLTAFLAWGSTILFFFVWFGLDGLELIRMEHTVDFKTLEAWKVPALLVFDGFLKFVQNVSAYSILFLVTPTSHAVASITRRPITIGISIYVFHNSVNIFNILGIIVLLIGSSLYTYVKLDDKNAKLKNQLPVKISTISAPEVSTVV